MTLPARASVVIIGGGIIGCSLAYHLAKRGISDVVLLERRKLSCGTTWHSVGSVGELRGTPLATELARYTVGLLRELEVETGQPTGLKQPGSIMLALNPDRLTEMKRTISVAKALGLVAELIGTDEIAKRCPHVRLDDVLAGMWIPTDGRVNATDTTLAYAKGARQRGARVIEDVIVENLLIENDRVIGVKTQEGEIKADAVALCTGLWSREFAGRHGVSLPLHAAEHFYAVTEPVAELSSSIPMIRVPDESTYYKDDAGKLLFGCLERKAKPWGMDGVPPDFSFDSLPPDLDHFEPILTTAMERFPLLQKTGIRLFFNGPETFTADGKPLIGETPEVKNLFVACGMNTVGIISSGSVGKILAEWIHDRRPPAGFTDVDVRRTLPFQAGDRFLFDRTVEALGILYDMDWPNRQYASARGARRSPLHHALVKAGAMMGESVGWEVPLVMAPNGTSAMPAYSYGKQNWLDWSAAEFRAATESCAIFDRSHQAKILVEGPGAAALLRWVCATPVDLPIGEGKPALWLNEGGRIVSMPTVVRIGAASYLLLTAPGSQRRDVDWLRRHAAAAPNVAITDVTSGWAVIDLIGPKATALVAAGGGGQPGTVHNGTVGIGYAPVFVWQESNCDLPGWRLLVSAEFAEHALERLLDAGRSLGARCAGAFTARALRIESGHGEIGVDFDDTASPAEVGLHGWVATDRDFLGKTAVASQRGQSRMICLSALTDLPSHQLFRQEPIIADGKVVGIVTGGAYGHRTKRPVALGWLSVAEPSALAGNKVAWQVEIAGERVPAQARLVATVI